MCKYYVYCFYLLHSYHLVRVVASFSCFTGHINIGTQERFRREVGHLDLVNIEMSDTNEDLFETTYAVDIHCEACTNDIKKCLENLSGIKNVSFNMEDKLMYIEGSTAPSHIISALHEGGKDAILRGTGKPNSAAVSILDGPGCVSIDTPVRGLVRAVTVSDTKTLFDITMNGVPGQGPYFASIREFGNVSNGAASTGNAWYKFEQPIECNVTSDLDSGLFSGQVFVSGPMQAWELIGKSFVITSNPNHEVGLTDSYEIYGVIARSAGIWENNKQLCSCTGKTIWDERKEAIDRNIK